MLYRRQTTHLYKFRVARWLIAMIGVLGLGNVAMSQQASGRLVYLPMVFHAEARTISTTACLQVTERAYSQAGWWTRPNGDSDALERAFKSVIAAIVNKDRAALVELSDPAQTTEASGFEKQARAYFGQFEALELVTVPRAYEFDGLAVFFAGFRYEGQIQFAPFVFARDSSNFFRFLPKRTDKLTFAIVQDWFNSMWGSAAPEKPEYCSDREISRANYQVSLDPVAWQSSRFFLAGGSLDASGDHASVARQVRSIMAEMKSALNDDEIGEFVTHLTPGGGNRLRVWFSTAEQAERDSYRRALTQQQAFFVFDASPLIVAYTRLPDSTVQVMYFTASANNGLLWTNSSHVTDADRLFKKGVLHDSALLKTPFSNFALN